MLSPRAHKLLADAAQLSRERINEDRDKVSSRLQPLLERMSEEFLDPSKSAQDIVVACSRDRAITSHFKRELGRGPAAYLRRRRMETAARLLTDTDLEVWQIGHLVFDDDIKAFSSRFKRWAGMPPTEYREAAHSSTPSERTLEHDLRTFARVINDGGDASQLTAGQRRRLTKHLSSFDKRVPPMAADGADLERGMALRFWEKLRALPHDEQSATVRQPCGLETTALFDVLREKSREEGRKDRQEGVRVAELAIASLDGVEDYLSQDEFANRTAQGYAWLGNAWGLALDYGASGRCFAEARQTLPTDPEPEVLGELCELEADMFTFQGKLEEALELTCKAVELFRSLGDDDLLARALVTRSCVSGRLHGWASALPDLDLATKLLGPKTNPHLALVAYHNLMSVHELSGQFSEASELLPKVWSLSKCAGDPLAKHHIEWVEGRLLKARNKYRGAYDYASKAQRGFIASGELAYAAAVDLDLAEISLRLGETNTARDHALRAVPIFESFGNHHVALAGLALLKKIATNQVIRLKKLEEIQHCLRQLLHLPSSTEA